MNTQQEPCVIFDWISISGLGLRWEIYDKKFLNPVLIPGDTVLLYWNAKTGEPTSPSTEPIEDIEEDCGKFRVISRLIDYRDAENYIAYEVEPTSGVVTTKLTTWANNIRSSAKIAIRE